MSKSKQRKKSKPYENQTMNQQPKVQVKVLAIREYEGYHIMVQNHGQMFQYIIFHDGKFYTSYNEVRDRLHYTDSELKHAGDLCLDQAIATIQVMLHKDNPDELLEKHHKEVGIVEVLEKNLQPQVHES